MPHHGHDEEHGEHEEPVNFQDKRRIDPETGQVRQPAGGQPATDGGAAAGAGEDGDALSQAERILNEAAAGAEGDAADAGITGAQDPDTAGASVREEELRNDLLRVQAEFVNYKRRVERDRNVAKDNAIQSVLTALLPVLDDLDAARAAGDLAEGPFAAIAAKFDTVLSGFGLERQDQESLAGQPFDPAQHEAMLRQPSTDVPEEHIVQVFRNGYVREGRVLRAAQVMVSAGAEG
jgi:molecular chaperone GrpE